MSSSFERAGPVEHLLQELRAKDIQLRVEGADLRVSAPPGVLTAALREDLSRRKAELLAHLQAGGGEGSMGDVVPLVRVDRERDLPLSFAQERMWFLQRMDPEANPYRVEMLFALRADEADLQRAWNALLDRHEILRTTYRMNDEGRLVQIVHASQRVELPVVDLSGVAETELAPEMRNRARDFVRMPFDLKQGPIWRILVFSLHDGLLGVALCIHHIASDGWSINSLVDELKKLCSARAEGRTSQLAELPVQYADYAIWQRQWLQGERLARELDYWRERLAGMPMVLDVPLDYPRPAVQTFEGAGCALDLPEVVAAGISALGQRHRVTLFMTLLAVFKVLLFRYTGQTDIVVGAPIAGRDRPEIEHVQGLFLNTLVLRTELSGELRFSELLARVRDTTLGAYAHQDLPFEKLVDEIHLQRDLSRNPLYQATFNKPIVLAANPEARQAGLEISANKISGINADVQVDLSLTAHERSGSIALGLGYNTALFRQETIERMLVHYRMLLERAVDEPEAPIGELPLLTESERRQLLFDWNRTERAYPRVAGVHELFECQAAVTPDAIAVVSEAGQLSYGQLNERANRLAHHLRGLGVGEGVLVGLCVERSLDMLVGILGIVKAGGARTAGPGLPRRTAIVHA
ncbi:MAG: AMP-binding protein [Uliginosibacterium sp.]|nr:AMP-binding protein [Uliginosibacterium sp.]